MERIQAAIQKAKEQRRTAAPDLDETATPPASPRSPGRPAPATASAWAALTPFEPDAAHLARQRIVTFDDLDPAHRHFDMLRTKVLRTMRQNGWRSLGVTSPTAGCGKTTVSLNLAFSLAHQPDLRVALVDLDLRRPAVAKHLGLRAAQSVASVLAGKGTVAETFVRHGDNLAIGGNAQSMRNSSELLMNRATADGVAAIVRDLQPDVLIYDLPPMLQTDDVMAFLPHIDCVLLVAGAEKSRLDEVDKCEQDLAAQTNVLGVVLNMCRYTGERYGYY